MLRAEVLPLAVRLERGEQARGDSVLVIATELVDEGTRVGEKRRDGLGPVVGDDLADEILLLLRTNTEHNADDLGRQKWEG